MVLRLCITVELFCSPVRNIFPRISLHDLTYHRTMTKCLRQVSQSKVAFVSLVVFGLSVDQAERSSGHPPFHPASGSLVLCCGAAESSPTGPIPLPASTFSALTITGGYARTATR